ELCLGGTLLGDVAADEEVTPNRLRPGSGPAQEDVVTVLVHVACLEGALLLAAARGAHLVPGRTEIIGMNEIDGAAADHLLGPIAHDCRRTRADLHERSDRIGHQDEVPRGLENALPLLALPDQLALRALGLGEIARDLRGADDLARDRAKRRD